MAGATATAGRPGGVPAAGRLAQTSSSSAARRRGRASSRSASRSSAAAPPASPCANRLLQLLADDPETMERLGEVPVAVIEKAKTCGGHNLSGAVMRPGPLQELFPDLTRARTGARRASRSARSHKEAVYMTPTSKIALRIPPPPPFKNHGNEVISVSALARFQQRHRRGGRRLHPHRDRGDAADRRGRPRRRRALRRQGPRQGRRAARQLRARHRHQGAGRRCWPRAAGATSPAPAIREFDLGEGARAPGLGARRQGGLEGPQAAGPPDPHDRPVAAEDLGQVRPDRRHLDLPDEGREDRATTSSRSASSSTSSTPTPPRRPTTCCSSSSCTRWSSKILEGGERVGWGAKALPGGGYWSMPKLTMPGALLVGDSAGMVDTVALKGVHHCDQVRHARRRGDLQRRSSAARPRWSPTRTRSRSPRSARSSTRSATRASRSRRASSRAARSSTW